MQENNQEIWKSIAGYEGFYEVSNLGRVRSAARQVIHRQEYQSLRKAGGNIKKATIRKGGYKYVTLYKENKGKKKLLHRLIADAFIPNPLNKCCINHIDGKPSNNSIENLEWCTNQENAQHAHRMGLITIPRGSASPLKRSIKQLDVNGNLIKEWDCIRNASRALGINHYCIVNVCAGRDTTYKGFKWAYKR